MRWRMGNRIVWHSRIYMVFLNMGTEAKSSGRLDLMLAYKVRDVF